MMELKCKMSLVMVASTVCIFILGGCGTSEMLESHDLGNGRSLDVYISMSHSTVVNVVIVDLIQKNKFIDDRQTLLKVISNAVLVHIEILSSDSVTAYIYYPSSEQTPIDSVTLSLEGDQETIHWEK